MLMPLPQQRRDLLTSPGPWPGLARLHHDVPTALAVGLLAPITFFLARGDRHQDHVVLILARRRCPLGASTPTTVNGTFLIRDDLPHRIRAVEQVVRHGLAQHGDFGGPVHVLRR